MFDTPPTRQYIALSIKLQKCHETLPVLKSRRLKLLIVTQTCRKPINIASDFHNFLELMLLGV